MMVDALLIRDELYIETTPHSHPDGARFVVYFLQLTLCTQSFAHLVSPKRYVTALGKRFVPADPTGDDDPGRLVVHHTVHS